MLNILAISHSGEGYGLATKLAKEKNFVKFCSNSETGTGFKLPKRVSSISQEDEEDIILCLQNTTLISEGISPLVDMGRMVMGGGGFLTKLFDKDFSEKFLNLIHKKPLEGEEVEVFRFFNPTVGYLPFYIINKPYRRMMDGDHGSFYSTFGNVVFVATDSVYSYSFEDVEGFLRKVSYTGLVGFVFKGEGVQEFIPQLNLGMLYAFFELCLFPFTEILMSLLFDLQFTGKFRQGYGMSIMVSTPPFPFIYSNITPLDVFVEQKEGFEKHFVFEDLLKDVDNTYTGSFGVIGWSTAYGSTIREARRRVYRTIANAFSNPSLQYRRDIGEEVKDAFIKG